MQGTQSRGNGRTRRLMENETDRHKGRNTYIVGDTRENGAKEEIRNERRSRGWNGKRLYNEKSFLSKIGIRTRGK